MEVGWHLRLTHEAEMVFLVQAKLAPNVEDAVFVAGGWRLEWDRSAEAEGFLRAQVTRKSRGG